MSTGENITNAVRVIQKTYENINKFFADLDKATREQGYVSITPRFLRYKSDNDITGWMINSFIKLYQLEQDPLLSDDSGLRNGPIYGADIRLLDDNNVVPVLTVAQYRYDEDSLLTWKKTPSVSEHWGFYYPTCNLEYMDIRSQEGYFRGVPLHGKAKEAYWGLNEVHFRKLELTPINSKEKIKEDVIGTFDFLRGIE